MFSTMQEAQSTHREQVTRTIKTVGVQEAAVDAIRAAILSGEFEPGAALSEFALAQRLGISRTPVREALKQLQAEGLVVIKQRVGTFVSEPSRREIGELFELKEVLEGLAARLLARRGDVPEVNLLAQNITKSRSALAAGNLRRYAELVDEFHLLVVEGADQGKLRSHYRTLMNQLAFSRLVLRTVGRGNRAEQSLREHAMIADMIREKDHYGAELAMRRHVQNSHCELMEGLADTYRQDPTS
jgi:DNA-binding GntR family transcriptional regulator